MTVQFNGFELDIERRQLLKDGVEIHLTPKAFDLLALLMAETPRVLRKDELHQRLWPGTFVSDAALVVLIKELRKALEDRDSTARLIRTAHGIGYAFDGRTEQSMPTRPDAPQQSATRGRRLRLGWVVSTAIVVLGIVVGVWFERGRRSGGPAMASAPLEYLHVEQLTTSGSAYGPGISPDGKYVAYVQRVRGVGSGLMIRQTLGAGEIQVVAPEPGITISGATFSPDGMFVDYLRRKFGAHPELWRVSSLGGTPKHLIDDIWSSVTWSPDGRYLAFLRTDFGHGSNALIVAESDGSHERVLATRHRPLAFPSFSNSEAPPLAWSPDGRLIALEEINLSQAREARDGISHILFVDTRTATERLIPLASKGGSEGMAWANRGALLVSQQIEMNGPSQLWQLSYPTGTWLRRTVDLSSYSHIGISADGNSLVAGRAERFASVWVGDATGENARELVPSIPGNALIQLAWAGKRLLYTTMTERYASISSLDPDSSKAPDEFISKAIEPSATADGRVTVFVPSDFSGIWKADANGRNYVQVVQGVATDPKVTPDGHWVLFVSQRSGRQSLWIVPTDGGTPRQVTNQYVAPHSVQVSSDSRSLLFLSVDEQNQSHWSVCQLPDCSSRREVSSVPTERVRWTPDGRGIALVAFTNPPNLWVQPLDGSPRHQLTHLTDETPIVDFAWSSDGTQLAIARAKVARDIVLFTGLLR